MLRFTRSRAHDDEIRRRRRARANASAYGRPTVMSGPVAGVIVGAGISAYGQRHRDLITFDTGGYPARNGGAAGAPLFQV